MNHLGLNTSKLLNFQYTCNLGLNISGYYDVQIYESETVHKTFKVTTKIYRYTTRPRIQVFQNYSL